MKVFWFDTETSGTDPKRNGIIQLAGIMEVDGEEVERIVLYGDCADKEVEQKALEINGFKSEQLLGFPSKVTMYHHLHAFFARHVNPFDKGDKMIAGGYNVDFDVRFLRQLWYECGDRYFGSFFAFGTLDPAALFRYMQWRGIIVDYNNKLRLTDLAEYLGIETAGAHDAMVDIEMTMKVMHSLTVILKEGI